MEENLKMKFENEISIRYCDSSYTLAHSHEFLELAYVTNGTAQHVINNEKMIIQKGDYFIIDYETIHSYQQIGDEKFEVINCLFMPELIDKTLKNCRDFSQVINSYLLRFSYEINHSPANRIFHDDNQNILELLLSIYDEFTEKKPGYVEIMRGKLIEIFIHTMRKASISNDTLGYDNISKYIIDYINKNYMEKITLTDLCNKMKFSLPYMSRNFKQNTGMTFEHYLQKVRVEQSCRLLANTDKKIIEISQLIGYSDVKFFNKIFKKHLNMSPAEFKKLHK